MTPVREALEPPQITMADVRLIAGEGKLSAHDVLAAVNGHLRMHTPQPAAGWDEAIEAAAKWHESEAASARAIYSEMDRYSDDHEERAGWRSYKDKEDRHLSYAAHIRTLHREAPAPAEGVKLSVHDFSPENICRVLATSESVPVWIRTLASSAARPDTAEAQLREHCIRICLEEAAEWDSDDVQTLKNYAGHCANRIAEETALSPPSGGDEAKESEGVKSVPCPVCGGEAIHAIETLKRTIIKPDPSEPDRRERVARIIDPDAFSMIPGQSWETLARMEAQSEAQLAAKRKADAILAALDGGR